MRGSAQLATTTHTGHRIMRAGLLPAARLGWGWIPGDRLGDRNSVLYLRNASCLQPDFDGVRDGGYSAGKDRLCVLRAALHARILQPHVVVGGAVLAALGQQQPRLGGFPRLLTAPPQPLNRKVFPRLPTTPPQTPNPNICPRLLITPPQALTLAYFPACSPHHPRI